MIVLVGHMLLKWNTFVLGFSILVFTWVRSVVSNIGTEVVVDLHTEVTLLVSIFHQVELASECGLHTGQGLGSLELILLWATATNASLGTEVDKFALTSICFGESLVSHLVLDITIIIDVVEAIAEFGTKLSLVLLSTKFRSGASESDLGGILLDLWHSSIGGGGGGNSFPGVIEAVALILGLFLLFHGCDVFFLLDVSIIHGLSLKVKLIIDFLIR